MVDEGGRTRLEIDALAGEDAPRRRWHLRLAAPVRTAFSVAALGWRLLKRDRVALIFNFLVPVAVASVLVGIHSAGQQVVVGVVAEDDGMVSTELVDRLEDTDLFELRRFDDRAAMQQAVREREVTAAVVVPAGAGSPGTTGTIELVGPPGVDSPSGVRAVVQSAVAETAAALQMDETLRSAGLTDTEVTAERRAIVADASGTERADDQSRDDRIRDAVADALVGTLVLFIFMNTMAASAWLPQLGELGIMARVRGTRASAPSFAVGLGLGLTSFALAQAILVLATGRLLFGFSWVGWPALLVAVVLVALSAGALGMLMGTFLPSPEAGATIAAPVGFLLAMLGGCLWPLEIVGPTLRSIGGLTPHAWAIDALRTTGVDGQGLGDTVKPFVVLLLFAVALITVGARRLWRLTNQV